MKTFHEIAEEAAQKVIDAHDVKRFTDEPGEEPTETAIQTFGWELGDGAFTYEQGLGELVKAAVEIDRAQYAHVFEDWAEEVRESLATDKSNDWSEELAALDQIKGEAS